MDPQYWDWTPQMDPILQGSNPYFDSYANGTMCLCSRPIKTSRGSLSLNATTVQVKDQPFAR